MGFARDLGGPLAGKILDNPSSLSCLSGAPGNRVHISDKSAGLVKDIAFMLAQGGELRVEVCGKPRRSDKAKELWLWAAKNGYSVVAVKHKCGHDSSAKNNCASTSILRSLLNARRYLKCNGWCYAPGFVLNGMKRYRDSFKENGNAA